MYILGFVGRGHCQWWAGSPLGSQNPHLWSGIIVAAIVYVIFILTVIKKRRGKSSGPKTKGQEIDQYTSHLKEKQERLTNKLTVLKESLNKGEISPREYAKLLVQYEAMLSDINKKLKEITDLQS